MWRLLVEFSRLLAILVLSCPGDRNSVSGSQITPSLSSSSLHLIRPIPRLLLPINRSAAPVTKQISSLRSSWYHQAARRLSASVCPAVSFCIRSASEAWNQRQRRYCPVCFFITAIRHRPTCLQPILLDISCYCYTASPVLARSGTTASSHTPSQLPAAPSQEILSFHDMQ